MQSYFQGHHFATLIRHAVLPIMDVNIALCTFNPNLKLFWTHSEELIHSVIYRMYNKVAPKCVRLKRKEQRSPWPLTLLNHPTVSAAFPQGVSANHRISDRVLRTSHRRCTTRCCAGVNKQPLISSTGHTMYSGPRCEAIRNQRDKSVQWHARILVLGA